MKEQVYINYLSGKIQGKPIIDYVSRCRRVEKGLNIDLDIEFSENGGVRVMQILEQETHLLRDKLHFSPSANIKTGLANLRNAVKKYFDACRQIHR